MSLKAVILAAGMGRRLRPKTLDIPKALVRVGDQPILDRQLRALRHVQAEDIVVVTGYRADLIQARYGAALRYIQNPAFATTNSAVSLWCARQELAAETVYLHSDVVFAPEILEAVAACPRPLCLAVDEHPCDEEAMKVRRTGDRIIEINKTMALERAAGEFIGIAKWTAATGKKLAHALQTLMNAQAHSAYTEAAFQQLMDQDEPVHYHPITSGAWAEIDTEEDLQAALRLFEDGVLQHG